MATSFLADLSASITSLAETASARIVSVHGRDGASSSGFLWGPGLVVSAEETVERDDDLEVTLPGGERVSARLVGRDPSTAIALVGVEGAAGVTPWTAAGPVRAGSVVVALGRSDETLLTAFGIVGEVGEKWQSMRGGTVDRRIRLDLALNGRTEGGAIVDAEGALVGLAVLGPRRRALVIPHETVARVVGQLTAKGYVARGYLGVGLHPLRGTGSGEGAIVISLDENGPAKAAGILVGDVFRTFDGAPVRGVEDIFTKLPPESVGNTVSLELVRGGQPVKLTVRIGERAPS